MNRWAYKDGVHLDFIRPGKPVENGYYVIPFTKSSQAPANCVSQDDGARLVDFVGNPLWMKRWSYLFPGMENSPRADVPVADRVSGRPASQNAMPAESCTR
jgi:hypothetical protein